MIVELESNVWLADGFGNPSRTIRIENAKEFETMEKAITALKKARQFHLFKNARIIKSEFQEPETMFGEIL